MEEEEAKRKELNIVEVKGISITCVELSINSVVGLNDLGTMKVRGKLQDEEVIVLIDCGATHNFIYEKLVKLLQLSANGTPHYGVILGSGKTVQSKGVCEGIEIQLEEWTVKDEFLPLELGGVDIILGMQWLYSLGVTKVDWKNLLLTFQHQGRKMSIKEDSSLTKSRVSLKNMMKTWGEDDQDFLVECRAIELKETCLNEKLVGEMLVSGVIRPSSSLYSSLVLLVKKKDGSRCFCVDYRALNNATIPDKFSIPVIEELFDELNGASLFSKIDLKAGYHQIRMNEEDIEKTAFRTYEGHYEFLVIRSIEEHLEHLEEVLKILRENELYANRKKCSFAKPKVEYLGHIISEQGVEVDSKKIKSVAEWPCPISVREVRVFLGLTGYYRRFARHYGFIAAPLTQLLNKRDLSGLAKQKKPLRNLKRL
ncbi:Retrotransposable element Tf2 [Cucumis melo var. makuwa]|uniref:Retrotransposable element Tf2 n=1 Tax=Cucumis melo var. makuwa TaxID=1194695 RepID=A0A5A7TI70_CUCMM|nr:Retrotransposable element Tf2 [Cucumis melo var. makuwa]